MADRFRDRPYQDDDYGREDPNVPPRPLESDPLAELARLIGQTDPFSTFGRDSQQAPARRDHDDTDDAAGYYHDQPVHQPSWMRNRPPAQDASYGDDQSYDPHRDDGGYANDDQGRGRGADNSRYDMTDPESVELIGAW